MIHSTWNNLITVVMYFVCDMIGGGMACNDSLITRIAIVQHLDKSYIPLMLEGHMAIDL